MGRDLTRPVVLFQSLTCAASAVRGDMRRIELQRRQAGVEATFLAEPIVRAFLDDPPLVHDDDAVGLANGGEAMCDHQGGAIAHQPVERVLHEPFAFRVEGAGGLIEQ